MYLSLFVIIWDSSPKNVYPPSCHSKLVWLSFSWRYFEECFNCT